MECLIPRKTKKNSFWIHALIICCYFISNFQEAGRAGRDKKLSYSILLYNDLDINDLKKQINNHYPKIEFIKSIYVCRVSF